jgi:hypothetical protein
VVTVPEVPQNSHTVYSEEMTSIFRVISNILDATSLQFLSDIC